MRRSIAVWMLLFVTTAFAETPEEKGLAIAVEADRRDEGYGDFTVQLTMILKNRHGQESVRHIRVKSLEGANGNKSLSIFDQPLDIQGTILLTYTHKTDPDDQWLYLPALKRVKRIASADKSGSFMGSEFAYEDIGSQEVEKYRYNYIRDERYEGQDCFVSERYPVDSHSGYTREVAWIDKAEYRPMKIDYYDRKGALLKTLVWRGYRQYLNKHWRADEMEMVNHQSGKSTRLLWEGYTFRSGIKPSEFTQERLTRTR